MLGGLAGHIGAGNVGAAGAPTRGWRPLRVIDQRRLASALRHPVAVTAIPRPIY